MRDGAPDVRESALQTPSRRRCRAEDAPRRWNSSPGSTTTISPSWASANTASRRRATGSTRHRRGQRPRHPARRRLLGLRRAAQLRDPAARGAGVPAPAAPPQRSPSRTGARRCIARSTWTRSACACFDADGRRGGRAALRRALHLARLCRSPRSIPLLRRKVSRTLERAGFEPQSHDGKALHAHPRHLPARRAVPDLRGRALRDRARHPQSAGAPARSRSSSAAIRSGASSPASSTCRASATTPTLRQRFAAILEKAFRGTVDSFNTQLDEAVLARVHYIVRDAAARGARGRHRRGGARARRGRRAAGRTGSRGARRGERGEEAGHGAAAAATARLPDRLSGALRRRGRALRHRADRGGARGGRRSRSRSTGRSRSGPSELRFKIYRAAAPVALSDVLPMLEHLGLKVITEVPYRGDAGWRCRAVWMQDFALAAPAGAIDVARLRQRFEEAFARHLGRRDGERRLQPADPRAPASTGAR